MSSPSAPVTADQFIAGIPNFEGLDARTQTDLLALYLLGQAGSTFVTVAALESLRQALHLAPHNRLAQYLSEHTSKARGKSVRYVKTTKGYALERSYTKALESNHLGRPTARHLATSLRGTLAAIRDPVVQAYLEEAIACFEYGQLRWLGALRTVSFGHGYSATTSPVSTWKWESGKHHSV